MCAVMVSCRGPCGSSERTGGSPTYTADVYDPGEQSCMIASAGGRARDRPVCFTWAQVEWQLFAVSALETR